MEGLFFSLSLSLSPPLAITIGQSGRSPSRGWGWGGGGKILTRECKGKGGSEVKQSKFEGFAALKKNRTFLCENSMGKGGC